MLSRFSRSSVRGNALIEYALPAGIFVVSLGIIATTVDVNGMVGAFFASANGDPGSAIQGDRYIAKSMGLSATGAQGNGSGNFTPSGAAGGLGGGGGGFTGGYGPGGITSSGGGNGGAEASGGQGQDEVLARLNGSKNAMDVYNAIKDSGMSQQFKELVHSMALTQYGMSASMKGKSESAGASAKTDSQIDARNDNMNSGSNIIKNQRLSLDASTYAVLLYGANPAHAAELSKYGGASVLATLKALGGDSSEAAKQAMKSLDPDMLNKLANQTSENGVETDATVGEGGAALAKFAQDLVMKSLGIDPNSEKGQAVLEALKNGASQAELEAIAAGASPTEAKAAAALADGTCANGLTCLEEREKLMTDAKAALLKAQLEMKTEIEAKEAAEKAAEEKAAGG